MLLFTLEYTPYFVRADELITDDLKQGSSTFSGLGPIYIFHITLWAAVIADYKIIMDILNIIIGAWGAGDVSEVPMA